MDRDGRGPGRPWTCSAAPTSSTPTPGPSASARSVPSPTRTSRSPCAPNSSRRGCVLAAGLTGSLTDPRTAHAVSKNALIAPSRQPASAGTPYGACANCVSPATTDTDGSRADPLADAHRCAPPAVTSRSAGPGFPATWSTPPSSRPQRRPPAHRCPPRRRLRMAYRSARHPHLKGHPHVNKVCGSAAEAHSAIGDIPPHEHETNHYVQHQPQPAAGVNPQDLHRSRTCSFSTRHGSAGLTGPPTARR